MEWENSIFLIDGEMVDISKLSFDELSKLLDEVNTEIESIEKELIEEDDEDINIDEIINAEE